MDSLSNAVVQGRIDLSIYATHFWMTHLIEFLKGTPVHSIETETLELLDLLHERYQETDELIHFQTEKLIESPPNILTITQNLPATLMYRPHLAGFLSEFEKIAEQEGQKVVSGKALPISEPLANSKHLFLQVLERIAEVMVLILQGKTSFLEPMRTKVANYAKQRSRYLYCCRAWACGEYFATRNELDEHHMLHSQGIKCTDPSCSFSRIGFPSAKALKRHILQYHPPAPPPPLLTSARRKFICSGYNDSIAFGCGRRFATDDELERHRNSRRGTKCDSDWPQRVRKAAAAEATRLWLEKTKSWDTFKEAMQSQDAHLQAGDTLQPLTKKTPLLEFTQAEERNEAGDAAQDATLDQTLSLKDTLPLHKEVNSLLNAVKEEFEMRQHDMHSFGIDVLEILEEDPIPKMEANIRFDVQPEDSASLSSHSESLHSVNHFDDNILDMAIFTRLVHFLDELAESDVVLQIREHIERWPHDSQQKLFEHAAEYYASLPPRKPKPTKPFTRKPIKTLESEAAATIAKASPWFFMSLNTASEPYSETLAKLEERNRKRLILARQETEASDLEHAKQKRGAAKSGTPGLCEKVSDKSPLSSATQSPHAFSPADPESMPTYSALFSPHSLPPPRSESHGQAEHGEDSWFTSMRFA
ncbi:hypothetical protein EJ04DRAFT_337278 [Polyplosphaeria fusca]|uniref:C2H2-type domain-containing protein n=1 Tax=Polyplosphaeria fusca TaxID=682080 RepID=A0A9P4QVS2_9PLEO|nr:hypothetical protein EJ04DRAFT_337278 [Polyplosphaeria fusca]